MNISRVEAKGVRYISQITEFKDGLPHGILNKKKTDCGGTFAAMNCSSNYIVVVPFTDLIYSILEDPNMLHISFGVYSGINYEDFKNYITTNALHKIVVTYDSLPKLISWLNKNGILGSEYRLLVDEFHLLLQEIDYREKAIFGLLKSVEHFGHYTFMSATPINDNFLTKDFTHLPYTEIEWNSDEKIESVRVRTARPVASVVKLIDLTIAGDLKIDRDGQVISVDQLFIFINSVKGIRQIIENTGLTKDDVKVVCTNSIRNSRSLGKIAISKATAPNKKVNLFTKKGYQGCNLFTKNGLAVVVSDGKMKHTLIDIGTTLFQIAGRFRINDDYHNVFQNLVWHIYSFTNDKTFSKACLSDIAEKSHNVVSALDKLNKDERKAILNNMSMQDLFCYHDKENDAVEFSELKQRHYDHKYELENSLYTNGHSVRYGYEQAGLDPGQQQYIKSEDVAIKQITTTGFGPMLEYYISMRQDMDSSLEHLNQIEKEFPLFKEAYNVLGISVMKTCKFKKSHIEQKLLANECSHFRERIYNQFFEEIGEDQFVSNKEAKVILKSIISGMGLTTIKPRVSKLAHAPNFTVCKTQSRVNKKQVDGIILKKIPFSFSRYDEIYDFSDYTDTASYAKELI